MTWKERKLRGRQFWLTLPPLASALFFASVFFLFGSIGFIFAGPQDGLASAAGSALFSGLIAVGFAWLGTRAHYIASIILALAVAFGSPFVYAWLLPNARTLPGPASWPPSPLSPSSSPTC